MTLLGVKITEKMLTDGQVISVVQENFNCYYPEKALKMDQVWLKPAIYNFAVLDRIVALAVSHGARFRGHTLIWHLSLPQWLESGNYSREQIWHYVSDYLAVVIERYEGKIEFWDVVNEAIDEDGNVRKSFWSERLGQNWIMEVFRLVRSLTHGKLFYCDYRIKNYRKWSAIYELLAYMYSLDLCDGIAIQMQVNTFPPPPLESIRHWVHKFKSAGLIVHAPEIVVWSRMQNKDHWLVQNNYYNICKTAIDSDVDLIGFWAIFANYQWHWDLRNHRISWLFDHECKPLKVWQKIKSL